jgi:DNA polymerase-1
VDAPGLFRLCERLKGRLVAVDLETTQLSPFGPTARVVCAAVTFDEGSGAGLSTWVVGLSHPDSGLCRQWQKALHKLAGALKQCSIVAHNASFDLTWIKVHTGVNLYDCLVGDTALSAHILNENIGAGLKHRAQVELGAEPWMDFSWKELAKGDADGRLLAEREEYYRMTTYCGEDTFWTYLLYQKHSKEMGLLPRDRETLLAAVEDDHDPDAELMYRLGLYHDAVGLKTVQALAAVEENGFALDHDYCERRLAENARVVEESDAELRKVMLDVIEQIEMGALRLTPEIEVALAVLDGEPNWSPGAKWFKSWAVLMCAAGHLRVAARTPKGQVQWSKEVLDRQARKGSPVAATLRALRIAQTESAYVQSWLNEAQHDGRIRASYNYYQVVTGRLSCSGPNLQQVARSLRTAFCAAPGHVLVSADYSQVELRVAAFQARCEPMMAAYRQGEDLHTLMAAISAQKQYADVTSEERQKAKAANFGFLFGMGATKFISYAEDNYGVEFAEAEAEDVRAAFFKTWDGLAEWHARMRNLASRHGFVVSPLGRIRHLPGARSRDDYEQGRALRQAINSPVQGMASDIMMLAVWRLLDYLWLKPVAVVHDAVIVECPEDRAEEARAIVKEVMERAVLRDMADLGVFFDVPLVADISVGKSWAK